MREHEQGYWTYSRLYILLRSDLYNYVKAWLGIGALSPSGISEAHRSCVVDFRSRGKQRFEVICKASNW